jgi:Arc/MetJ-type ribon-helix-helix transcriptional regulator
MPSRPRAYAFAVSGLPELQELLGRFCGTDAERGNVVMMRLSDAALARLDELVESGLFGSRSEASAFLVGAGIESQKELFRKVGRHSAEIQKIRRSLGKAALEALRARPAPRPIRPTRPRGRKTAG